MKKLLVFILLLFSLEITVNASTLITTPNLLNNSYVANEEFIYENNVNWKTEGEGSISYFQNNNQVLNTKDVKITSLEKLKNGYDVLIMTTNNYNPSVDISRVVTVDENSYFVLGRIETGYYPYDTMDEKMFPYLAYYKNNILQWEKIVKENRYGNLTSAVVINDKIAVYGYYDSLSLGRNVFVNIFDFNKEITFEKELLGSGNDVSDEVYYSNNKLIITGVTNSIDLDFYSLESSEYDVFIGSIHLATNHLKVTKIGNKGIDNLISSTFYNDKLYLLIYFRGEGYFNPGFNPTNNKAIVVIDQYLEMEDWRTLNIPLTSLVNKVNYFDNKIIVSYTSIDNKLYFYILSSHLDFERSTQIILKDVKDINEYKIISEDNIYLIIKARNQAEQTTLNFYFLDSNYLVTNSSSFIQNYYSSLTHVFNYDTKINVYLKTFNNYNLNIYSYSNIVIKENKVNTNKYRIDDYDIYLNNKIIPKYKISNNAPSNAYGYYEEKMLGRLEDFEIVIPVNYYYFPLINIIHKDIYDLGVELSFNGTGYLNDELIKTKYKVREAGKYVLEVVGSFNEKKVIHFEVKSLSYNQETSENFPSYTFEFTTLEQYPNLKVEYIHDVEERKQVDSKSIIITSLFLSLGLGGGLFIPLEFWRKKNV